MLAERGGDPDVERLMEGFAFLTARIRERLDDDVPEVIHTLTDLLLPHYLRTLPACSIVEFTPVAGALRTRQRSRAAPSSRPPRSRAPRAASAPPRTSTSCPLTVLTDVVVDTRSPSSPTMRVQLQTHEAGRAAVFHPDGVRLYLHAEPQVCTMLALWMMHHLRRVSRCAGSPSGAQGHRARRGSVRPSGFEAAARCSRGRSSRPGGYRLLQEYFTLPAKFNFFDVEGPRRGGPPGPKTASRSSSSSSARPRCRRAARAT
jgi:type VI secretion system protein ImpG